MDRYRVDFRSAPWDTPGVGVKSKVHQESGKRLRLLELAPEFAEPDWCVNGHVGYVLEGQLEIDFGGQVVAFRAGDGIFIPPGEQHKHKGRAVTGTVRLILVEDA